MCSHPIRLKSGLYVPCGHCKACYLKQTYDWAHRIMVEAQSHRESCVITLTYAPDHLPGDNMIHYEDVQAFLKRFRERLSPRKIRYFVSCEYGDKHGRPHYHFICFGWFPPVDKVKYLFTRHGNKFYRCDWLNDVWQKGYATVGTLTEKSAFYCSKYIQKLNFRDMPVPPQVHMSLKPGIGECGYNPDVMLHSRKLYLNGHAYALPRYYQKLLDRDYPPDEFERVSRLAYMSDPLCHYVSSREQLSRDKISRNFLKKYTLKT